MKSLKAINSLLAIGVILGLAACSSGGDDTAGGSTGTGGTGTGGGTGGGGGVTTDNDNPPTNAQLDGDTVTVTFDGGFVTPGGLIRLYSCIITLVLTIRQILCLVIQF